MPQVKQIDDRIHDTAVTRRRNAMVAVKAETYVVYSIYHLDDPQGGYAVYSHDQHDWDFVGYMPAVDRSHLSQDRISCRKRFVIIRIMGRFIHLYYKPNKHTLLSENYYTFIA